MDSDPNKEYPKRDDSFRDSIGTIKSDGNRNWIYPQKPKGLFYNRRTAVSVVYLMLFFSLPFIKINGDPLIMMNIIERKFIIFGLVFFPQDLFLFALAMLTFMVFIVLFTVIFGRLFCGWACPQTIFMEMVFRKIEYWIEGDATKQRQLNKGPWNAEKIRKKGSKTFIFLILSFVFGNFFLSYIIGMDELIHIVQEPLDRHIGGFSGIFYWRILLCLYVFPRTSVFGCVSIRKTSRCFTRSKFNCCCLRLFARRTARETSQRRKHITIRRLHRLWIMRTCLSHRN
jgi:hypothetical protein